MKTQLHRGEALEAAVRRADVPLSRIADKLKISRSTLYSYFKRGDLDIETLDAVAKIIGWDYVAELKGVSSEVHTVVGGAGQPITALGICKEELGKTQALLSQTQQKLIAAYETIEAYQRTYGTLTV